MDILESLEQMEIMEDYIWKMRKELKLVSCMCGCKAKKVKKIECLEEPIRDDDRVEVFNNRNECVYWALKAIQDFYRIKNIFEKIDGNEL